MLPHLIKISLRARRLVALALFMLHLGQIMLGEQGKFLIEFLRAQTKRTKTPVQSIIFRVPMTTHISAES
jgi:hypothetical protein